MLEHFYTLLQRPTRVKTETSAQPLVTCPCSMLVERIDEDKDGFVSVEEMKRWIKHAQKRWIYDDVDRQWTGHDLNGDGLVSWEEYKNATYGYILGRDDTGCVTLAPFLDSNVVHTF